MKQMSKKVIIYDSVETEQDLVHLLNEIARLIENGNTSGHYPGWEIIEDEDE